MDMRENTACVNAKHFRTKVRPSIAVLLPRGYKLGPRSRAALRSIAPMNFRPSKHYLQFGAKTKISFPSERSAFVQGQRKWPVVMVGRLNAETGLLPVESVQMRGVFTEKCPVAKWWKGNGDIHIYRQRAVVSFDWFRRAAGGD